MEKKLRIVLPALLFGILSFISCSHKSPTTPYEPVAPRHGRIFILNNSEVPIRILGYTQVRGTQRVDTQLWIHIFPGENFYLHNRIDPDNSDTQIFPGGDVLTIRYVAEAPDPDNPGQPLFRNTVELTVNGTFEIQVKSGGDYGISPG
jgi:hypothetical protein